MRPRAPIRLRPPWLGGSDLRAPLVAVLVVVAFALGLAGIGRVPRAASATTASPTHAAAPGGVSPAPTVAIPTPTPDPAVWRFEGRVVDETGAALEEVCVVIGPHGCQVHGPHTDERGVYFIDMPQNPVIVYELRFERAGYTTVYYLAQPSGPTIFDVVLRRS